MVHSCVWHAFLSKWCQEIRGALPRYICLHQYVVSQLIYHDTINSALTHLSKHSYFCFYNVLKLKCALQSKVLPCLKSFSNLIYFMSYFPCSLIRSFSLLNSKVLRTFPTLLFIFMLTILFVCFYSDSETLIRVYCLS